MKKDSEKGEKKKQRLNKFKLSEADEADKTKFEKIKSFFSEKIEKKKEKRSDEPQKTMLEKLKSMFCCCKFKTILQKAKSIFSCCKRKKIKDIPRLKKFNYGIKRSKNDIKRLDKSLRWYIKQKLKLVIFLIVIYIIIFGAIVSIPITVNHLSNIGQNETKQERFL